MIFRFNPNASFIAVEVDIVGSIACRSIFALDTGATRTVVDEGLLNRIGYDASQAIRTISVNVVGGKRTITEYKLSTLSALGVDANNLTVNAFNVRSQRYEGLLGKDFFRNRVMKIDFRNGLIDLQ